MFEINDWGAAQTLYEMALVQARVPRQFWSSMATRIAFRPISIQLEPNVAARLKAMKRSGMANVELELDSKGSAIISAWAQERCWTNLSSLVQHWSPVQGSPGTSIVVFSPNLKHAQSAMMALAHCMLSHTFNQGSRPYRVEVLRTFELQNRMTSLPDVTVLPCIMQDLTSTQAMAVKDLLYRNNKVIAATNQSPQKFYEAFGGIPSYPFLVDQVTEQLPVVEFQRSIQVQNTKTQQFAE